MNIEIPDFMEEAFRNGLPVSIEFDQEKSSFFFRLQNFYKSGTVDILATGDGKYASAERYGDSREIASFDDLVCMNFDWWERSRDRHDGWKNPDEKWLPFFVKKGLVSVKTESVVTVTPTRGM